MGIQLVVNGKEKVFQREALTVAELLTISGIERPEQVAVQRNGIFVNKDEYTHTSLTEGDEIDFLYFMGGGAESVPATVYTALSGPL